MILICGASGLVGREICIMLDEMNVNYIGTYNKNVINKPNMYRINYSDLKELEEFLFFHKITSCLFCIVERLTDVCENNWNEIKKTNIDIVHTTSYLCNKLNIKFIHLSTDYVFDGSTQPNLPDSPKNPLQNYGISKLLSEFRVLKNCKNYCIIRTPVLYSKLSKIHDNAVCLIGKNVMDLRDSIMRKEDNYSIRRPLYIADLCKFIYDCIIQDYIGIYHFYNPHNKYTKYEICIKIGDYLNINVNHIVRNNLKCEGIAPRPYDTQLQDTSFDILKYKFTNFDESLVGCFQKYKHPKINVENKHTLFICLDMDGTIINTSIAHYNAYSNAFAKYNKSFLNWLDWMELIMNSNIDNYIKSIFNNEEFDNIKRDKLHFLKDESIEFTKNSELFLTFLIENEFNFCIVTNTHKNTVNIFKEKLPLLNKIKQWVYKDDYNIPKPDGECYEVAKNKFYNNEKYIIGVEDSMVGYAALKNHTDLIYIYENEIVFKNNDCFLFDDFSRLFA